MDQGGGDPIAPLISAKACSVSGLSGRYAPGRTIRR